MHPKELFTKAGVDALGKSRHLALGVDPILPHREIHTISWV